MIDLQEVKEYLRVDIEEDDQLLQMLITAAVEYLKNATGKEPFFIGKPQPIMVDCVLKNTGCSAGEAVIVGDRLYTDIATGKNAGVDAICVLSGEATLKDIEDGDIKPDFLFRDVKEIWQKLR